MWSKKNLNVNGINDWLKESDIFILDWGFWDVFEFLEDGGFYIEFFVFFLKFFK